MANNGISSKLRALVVREFPDRVAEATSLLERFGTESHHRELDRVRAGCLYLARGSMEDLRSSVKLACLDYRDVLMGAEYPNYHDGPTARAMDRAHYESWLKTGHPRPD